MQRSPEELERLIDLLQRQIRQINDATKQRDRTDMLVQAWPGTTDFGLVANTLYLFPIFPCCPINAAAVYLHAYQDPGGGGGVSRVQLALYKSVLDEGLASSDQNQIFWGASDPLLSNRTEWRRIEQSPIVASTSTTAMRLRWVFPRETVFDRGPGLWALGVVANASSVLFRGDTTAFNYAGIRTAGTVTQGDLPATASSNPSSSTAPISLTFFSKRGMKVMGQ